MGAPNVSFPEYNEPWGLSKFCRNSKGGKVFPGAIHLHRSTGGGAVSFSTQNSDTSDTDESTC